MPSKDSLRIFPEIPIRNLLPLTRHRPTLPITELPNFGLVWGCVLFVVMFVLIMLRNPLPPKGLWVNVQNHSLPEWQQTSAAETLAVYIDDQQIFYINGNPVLRNQLRAKLQEELHRRVTWSVYLEAHRDSPYGDTVFAIDTIQGLGAKVIWITPKIRQELNRNIGAPGL